MCKAELLNRYYVLSRTHCLADPISNNAHCEGSKDQCIKYQFFRPLHIFSVFQCCNHLDIPATLIPVCGLLLPLCCSGNERNSLDQWVQFFKNFILPPSKEIFSEYWKSTTRTKNEIWISRMVPSGWLFPAETRSKSTVQAHGLACLVLALCAQLEGGYGLL